MKVLSKFCHRWSPIASYSSVSLVDRKMQPPQSCIIFSLYLNCYKYLNESYKCWSHKRWPTRTCCLGWTWLSASAPQWEMTPYRTPRSIEFRSNVVNSSEWRKWRWYFYWQTVIWIQYNTKTDQPDDYCRIFLFYIRSSMVDRFFISQFFLCIHQSEDIRLEPELYESCKNDISKVCQNVAFGNAQVNGYTHTHFFFILITKNEFSHFGQVILHQHWCRNTEVLTRLQM